MTVTSVNNLKLNATYCVYFLLNVRVNKHLHTYT